MPDLNGAWEPNGYIGPRLEIRGKKLIRLWRNSPVLETGFTTAEEDGKLLLLLKNNALQYEGTPKPYATVKACWYADGAITLVDDFPITGESTEVLFPTKNSRYGNVTIVDKEILPQLRGEWVSGDTDMVLRFRGKVLEFGFADTMTHKTEVVALRSNRDGAISIRSRDPAREDIGMFTPFRWEGGVLRTYIPVCDAPAVHILFHKKIKQP